MYLSSTTQSLHPDPSVEGVKSGETKCKANGCPQRMGQVVMRISVRCRNGGHSLPFGLSHPAVVIWTVVSVTESASRIRQKGARIPLLNIRYQLRYTMESFCIGEISKKISERTACPHHFAINYLKLCSSSHQYFSQSAEEYCVHILSDVVSE